MRNVILLLALFIAVISAENQQKNALNISPLSILSGAQGSYEHLFGEKHGLFVEGAGVFWGGEGYSLLGQYRYHYGEKKGFEAPFIGPFIGYSRVTDIKMPDKETTYDLKGLKIGASWGKRWIFKDKFNIGTRIGYGAFALFDMEWDDPKKEVSADDKSSNESMSKIIGGIDGEISIGFLF